MWVSLVQRTEKHGSEVGARQRTSDKRGTGEHQKAHSPPSPIRNNPFCDDDSDEDDAALREPDGPVRGNPFQVLLHTKDEDTKKPSPRVRRRSSLPEMQMDTLPAAVPAVRRSSLPSLLDPNPKSRIEATQHLQAAAPSSSMAEKGMDVGGV